ncbi:MAG TPA: 3-oxoacyl-ACP reductase family protein [Syntrophorhabdales bacterium]|nr:3-oxoacyl-ACP reductase family protein [Syntrophorhabdales bacterium]
MRLKDKVAIVTGAARGLGRAYALRLAKEGAKVVVADILDGKETVDAITAIGGEALYVKTDVTSEESTQSLARKVVERFGRIDILVNNAALFADLVKKPFWEIPASEWDKVMAVNLKGPFLCAKAVYPQMKKQGKGKIINVASGTFYKGLPLFLHYVVSKGGNVAITRSMAREVGDAGINVNCIAPGYTETEVLKENPQDPPDVIKMASAARCIKRPETPDDLTGTIVFLSSDDSDFITGQTIIVDGGSALN